MIEGNPCKKDVLDDAEIACFDVCVALRPDDAENLAICQMASRIYQIKKTVCTVANPRNVELFKELGVTNAISGTYIVASMIEKASMVNELAKTLNLEDGSAVITELAVKKEFPICDEMIMDAKYFIIPGTLCIAAGYFLSYMGEEKWKWKNYKNKENIIVTLAWIMVIFLSGIPFVLTGKYNFTQAIFECTSGYSTTGLSVVNVTQTSHIFLFFRSVMLFVGGIGLVLVVITVLSDRYGMKLFEAEEPYFILHLE